MCSDDFFPGNLISLETTCIIKCKSAKWERSSTYAASPLHGFIISGGKLRTAESIVEEAKGKLSELEQRIKEAIEKNAQLKSVELMQVCICTIF